MDLIIDANILFAALIKESTTIDIIYDDNLRFFAPEFILSEFYKHKDDIQKKTKRSETEFNQIFETLKSLIILIPEEEFENCLLEAEKFSPDEDDSQYLALSLKLNIPIWSNDKRLKNQNRVKIYSTVEIINVLRTGLSG